MIYCYQIHLKEGREMFEDLEDRLRGYTKRLSQIRGYL